MNKFTIGSVFIETNEKSLKQSLNDIFFEYHKKNPNKTHHLDEKKYPLYKITSDIFSVTLWIKDNAGVEKKIFLDGSVFLNTLTIHTITLEGEDFSEYSISEFEYVFKKLLSNNSKGYIYYEIDGFLYRANDKNSNNYFELIDELFNAIPLEKQLGYKTLKDNLQSSFLQD